MSSESEALRASRTPISLRMEAMNCEFATMRFREDSPFPIYIFQPANACPFSKAIPDQECRTCRHHRIHVIGTDQPFWKHRYHGYGAVLPLLDEGAVTDVLAALDRHDGSPLRRPEWEPREE